MSLADLRVRIDAIDDQILELLEARAAIALQVAEVKRAEGRPLAYDPERERQVMDRMVAASQGRLNPTAIRSVYREIISACLALQRPLTVAYLGPEGTFSQMAARTLFGDAAVYRDMASIEGVFDAVARGVATRGVVPIENSTEGSVVASVRALLHTDLMIERELVLDIAHCLLTRAAALPQVRRVYSHPQALGQCAGWLRKNLPDVEWIQTASTAAAVQQATLDPTSAAIASRLAGELAGVPALVDNVQDMERNATRFVVIGPTDALATGDDRTLVAFGLDDGPGRLRRALQAFEDEGISLSHIESHPSRDRAWNYVFVAEMAGHRTDPACERALSQLHAVCTHVRVLGSFPRGGSAPN
jgi:chorismate mutase/prephenate dehydratase